MTRPKSDPRYHPLPISSFDPRYRELLLQGSREEVLIPCGSPAKAHRFQMVLCQYRRRLKEEYPSDRSQWEPLYGCVVGLKPGDKSIVRLYPRHSEFDDILAPVSKVVEAAAPPSLPYDILAEFDATDELDASNEKEPNA